MSRMLLILTVVVVALVLSACYLLPTPARTEREATAQAEVVAGKAWRPTEAVERDAAASTLRWGGRILTLAGLAIVASRFMGFLTAPLIGGVLTVATGLATLTLAELMARHWWIGPVILLALVALAVLEYLNDRDLLWRDPPWSGVAGVAPE